MEPETFFFRGEVKNYVDEHLDVYVLLPRPSILARTQEVYMVGISVAESTNLNRPYISAAVMVEASRDPIKLSFIPVGIWSR